MYIQVQNRNWEWALDGEDGFETLRLAYTDLYACVIGVSNDFPLMFFLGGCKEKKKT